MRYIDALKLVLEDEQNRTQNLLVGSVFLLIPLLGSLAIAGWHCEIAQRLDRGDPNPVPRLEFGDLMTLVERGIAPFVATMLLTTPIAIVAMVPAFLIPFFVAMGSDVALIVAVVVTSLLIGVLGVVVGVATMAVTTRAELTEDLGKTLELGPNIDYIKRNFGRILVAILIYGLLAWVVSMAGLVICCLGVFPASVIVQTGMVHLRMQIYEKHLADGGAPIERPSEKG